MKKNLRYGLIAVLILALLVVTGIVASAAGEVTLLDDTEAQVGAYDTLADAAAAATTDGYIINITADITGQAAATVDCADGLITIRGNGHTVTFAAGAGLTVAAGTSLDVENVTLATADYTAIGLTMAADAYDLNMTDVTINGFGTGVVIDTVSFMGFTNVTIVTEAVGINLMPSSAGGELTLTECTITPIRYAREPATIKDPENPEVDIPNPVAGQIILDGESNPTYTQAAGDACILCNGADIIIESGFYRTPTNIGAQQSAGFFWNDGGSGSHLTINGGEFTRFTNATVLFVCRGDGSTLPNFEGTPWITINDGTFTAIGNNPMFGCFDLPIKGDDDAETCVDLVINGGTFLATTTGNGNEAMFQLKGPFRLTIYDGDFECRGCHMVVYCANKRFEAGHNTDLVVNNIYGGNFVCNSLAQFPSSASYVSVLNFGEANTDGPQFTIRKNRINNQTSRGAIFCQNGSAAHGVINFYSGTFDILNEYGLDKNGNPDSENLTNANFCHGAGATLNFYGGTFNYDMDGIFIRLGDCDQYSVVNFLKNDGEDGIVLNMGVKAQRFLQISSAGSDHNDYDLSEGHMQGRDPAEYAAKGDKVIITIANGTFKNGRGWMDLSGSGAEIDIGADGQVGPTFIIDEPNDYGYGFIHFSNSASTLYSATRNINAVSTVRETKTFGTINIYSGTFNVAADVEALFNCHGGVLHIEGGDFTVNTAGIFQWRDQDKIGELEVEGGTFTLTGSGKIINYAVNYCVGNAYKGAITLNGGTFAATGTATGTLFSLTSPNHIDNAETNKGTAIFTLGSGVTISKVATARYFNIGAKMHTDNIVIQGDRVFEQDPTAGLGGYKPVAVAGGYKVQLTTANKVFQGATMNLTNEYELHTYWKLTEAEAANFTKLVMTGIKGYTETFEITEKTIRSTYPNGSDVEAGYKVVEVVLPKLPIQRIIAYYNLALYVDGNLTASIDYSAHEYLQILSYTLDAEKAAIQAPLIEAEATAEQLAAAVAEQTKTQKLAATLIEFACQANAYSLKDVETEFQRLLHTYSPYYVKINNDKGVLTPYLVGFEALDTPKAAAWTYTANTNANLTGVGARFDTTLQLYVKFTATDLTGITVTYKIGEGAPQEALIVNVGGNDYVAYTQFTNLDNLNADVTFTLAGDTNTQTCTYSFGAFIYSYQSIADGENKENVAVKNLAKALKQFSDAVAQYTA